jgi:hypothetical protein
LLALEALHRPPQLLPAIMESLAPAAVVDRLGTEVARLERAALAVMAVAVALVKILLRRAAVLAYSAAVAAV